MLRPASWFFLLLFFFALPLFASSEEALTRYIVSQVLERVRADYPGRLPDSLISRPAPLARLISGDTLFIPGEWWGYRTTNDYRLHYYAAHLLYFRVLGGGEAGEAPETFLMKAGRAAALASAYVASLEKKDSVLSDLLAFHYLYQPNAQKIGGLVISRDWEVDSLKYRCLVKAALAYRCDSLHREAWLDTDQLPEYGLVRVVQTPLRWRRFRLELSLTNRGAVPAPFRLFLNGAGRDTSLYFDGFLGDTAVAMDWSQTLLKAVVDPGHRLLDLHPENQQFVSTEFLRKQRAASALALLLWDALSALAAFAGLFLCGIFFPPLLRLFYGNNAAWAGLFILAFTGAKLFLPLALFGFNLWGLVYLIHLIAARFSPGLMAAGAALASAGLYALLRRDGVPMARYRGFLKFIFFLTFLEPLLWVFWL